MWLPQSGAICYTCPDKMNLFGEKFHDSVTFSLWGYVGALDFWITWTIGEMKPNDVVGWKQSVFRFEFL